MPEYCRSKESGGTYFFTLVTFERRPILTSPESINIFRSAWKDIQTKHPFKTLAICILPDHIHAIWRLPEDDADYSMRWKEIKRIYSRGYLDKIGFGRERNDSRVKRKEVGIWQRRFWEHTLRNEVDLYNHIEYIHYNPVKHGLVKCVADWKWSSFHKFVKLGIYPSHWGGGDKIISLDKDRGE